MNIVLNTDALVLNDSGPFSAAVMVPWQYAEFVSTVFTTTQIVVEQLPAPGNNNTQPPNDIPATGDVGEAANNVQPIPSHSQSTSEGGETTEQTFM